MGWQRPGQPPVYQRSSMDPAHRRSLARPAPDYGDWKNTHRRFCRWRDKGVWEKLLEQFIDEPDFEWLMIRRQPRQSPPRNGCPRRQPGDGADKRGLNSKIHLAVDAHGMPVRILITAGSTADCTQAQPLINGLDAEKLLADRGYDTDAILREAAQAGMEAVIAPKRNRKIQRDYDKALYRHRHLVENAFLTSNAGAGLQPATPKTPPPSWRPYKFNASPYGSISHDDTI